MSIRNEIDRINSNVANTYSALKDMGADIPTEQNTNNLPATVTAVKSSIESEIAEQDDIIIQIQNALNGKASGGVVDSDLPAGYTRVSYILFTDEQIVDSEVICNQNTKIRVLFTRENSEASYLYGVSSDSNTASVTAYLSNNGTWRFGAKYTSRPHSVLPDIVRNAVVDSSGIQHETGKVTYSGVEDFETVGTLLIGACRDADGSLPATNNTKYSGRIFLFEMWENDEQVLKLIPVTDGNGAYRFWDIIRKKFHDSITDVPLDGGNL